MWRRCFCCVIHTFSWSWVHPSTGIVDQWTQTLQAHNAHIPTVIHDLRESRVLTDVYGTCTCCSLCILHESKWSVMHIRKILKRHLQYMDLLWTASLCSSSLVSFHGRHKTLRREKSSAQQHLNQDVKGGCGVSAFHLIVGWKSWWWICRVVKHLCNCWSWLWE